MKTAIDPALTLPVTGAKGWQIGTSVGSEERVVTSSFMTDVKRGVRGNNLARGLKI